jgi:hypothetical protein
VRKLYVALVVATVLVTAGCVPRGPGHGPHGGGRGRALHLRATGFFHTELERGRWWLVTPDGRPFYSHGMNHVTARYDVDRTTGRCPYCDAIDARYPSVDAWRDATTQRLRTWGFNTVGAWSDDSAFADRMPYTPILAMASGSDWFAPEFETHAAQVAEAQVAPRRDDPDLLGWFLDNELKWGRDYRSNETMLEQYTRLPEGAPGRAVADRYAGDPSGFLTALATRYYSVATGAVRRADPNHLVLGTRLVSFLTPPEVVAAARPWLDVLSVNHYSVVDGLVDGLNGLWGPFVPVDPELSRFHELSGLPVLVTEYSFRAADAGVPNSWPPIYLTAPTQTGRADMWQAKVEALYAAPWIVGDHWFEWADQPVHGRFDGEDNNFGLVSNDDVAYEMLTDRMTAIHATAPDAVALPRARCGAWAWTADGHGATRLRCTVRLGGA